jgi:hypothetical protein
VELKKRRKWGPQAPTKRTKKEERKKRKRERERRKLAFGSNFDSFEWLARERPPLSGGAAASERGASREPRYPNDAA